MIGQSARIYRFMAKSSCKESSSRDVPQEASRGLSYTSRRRFVFPHTQNRPPELTKPLRLALVALYVRCDLLVPPCGIRLRQREVLRASMPEATVNEHAHSLFGEDEVRLAAKRRLGAYVCEKAHSRSGESSS